MQFALIVSFSSNYKPLVAGMKGSLRGTIDNPPKDISVQQTRGCEGPAETGWIHPSGRVSVYFSVSERGEGGGDISEGRSSTQAASLLG